MARRLALLALALFLCAYSIAQANCGAAFCAVTTNWNLQGIPPTAGNGRIDLRYEFIDQSRPWSDSRRADNAGDEEVRELKTINRNLLATFDYTLTNRWSVGVNVPLVSRSHAHVAEPENDPQTESWGFTRIGDARVLASWRDVNEKEPTQAWGAIFGLKLPTGTYRIDNADGVRAERSLQPGSGSTDAIIGAFVTQPAKNGALWFGQVTVQTALATKDDYRPGNIVSVTGGYRWPLTLHLTAIVQLNATVRGRDTGANAENTVTGSNVMSLSPGLSWGVSPLTDLYAFVQLPVYRHTNGAQLTFDWAVVAGVTRRF